MPSVDLTDVFLGSTAVVGGGLQAAIAWVC